METQEIRQKLQDYIAIAPEEKVKALYTVLESEIQLHLSHWDDPEFVAEMDDRMQSIKDGTATMIPLEEVLNNAKAMIENARKKIAV